MENKPSKHAIEPSQLGPVKETKAIRQTSSLVHISCLSGVFTYQKVPVDSVEST